MRQLSLLSAFLVVMLTGAGYAPAAPQQDIPTPESVLGFQPGADFELATYDESLEYFRRLDAASDRIELVEVGRTSEGRPWYMALVSSPENLANVERYREISLQLAHPEGLSDEQARRLASEGKAIVHIDGGLHATEVAHTQHTIQLAYDLVAGDDDPEIRAILDDVIVMLWPSVNPDGQNIVAEWYESNLGTPFETAPMVELYQKYVGHDNNRDAYMLSMIESRVIGRTWRHWEPQIIYIQHQSSPFPTRIWLPPFADPIASQVHPLMSRTVNFIGMAMAQALEERGQVGATHMIPFDAWYPGYIDYLPMLQNAAAFWTDGSLPLCHATLLHGAGLSREPARIATGVALSEPLAGWMVAIARRGRVYGHRIDRHARLCRQVQGRPPVQPLPGWQGHHSEVQTGASLRVSHPAAAA